MNMHYFKCNRMENEIFFFHTHVTLQMGTHLNKKKCSIKTALVIDDEWLDPHYLSTYSCILYVHFCSFINWVSFLRILFIVLSLNQAVVWRARREKHNHGALWLIMDLHNSSWISIDDMWISVIELWASIIGFMEIHDWNYGAPYHSIYEDP